MAPGILHLCTRYRRGGSEQRLRDLVAAVDADHRVVIGAESDLDQARADMPDAEVTVSTRLVRPPSPIRDPLALTDLLRSLRSDPVDLLVSHQSKAGLLARTVSRLTGVPTIHSLSMASTGPGYGLVSGLVFGAAERMAATWADRYLVVGADLGRRAVANGVPQERCQIVRSTVAFPSPGGSRSERKRSIPAVADVAARPWVVVVGSLDRRKNVARLPRLLRLILDRADPDRDPILLIAGEGPERAAITAEIERHQLHHHVRLLGHVGWAADLIAAADLQILISRAEGLPQVLVQGAAADTPFVCYEVDGPNELIELGARGTIVVREAEHDLADAAVRWLSQRQESTAARADLSSWRPDVVADGYRRACYEVLDLSGDLHLERR